MKNIHFRTYKTNLPLPENNWRDKLSRWFLFGVRNEDDQGDGMWQVFAVILGRGFSLEYDYWIKVRPKWYPIREWRFPNVYHVTNEKGTRAFYGTKFGFGKRNW